MKRRFRLGLVVSALALVAALFTGAVGAAVEPRGSGLMTAGPLAAARADGQTGVRLVYFRAVGKKATKTGRPVAVSWRTGEEANVLGFNVYRVVKAKQTKLNRVLLPAKSKPSGSVYLFNDRLPAPLKTACYRLQVLGLDGSKTWLARTCSKQLLV